MKSELNIREMLALGFMAFALFLGAGNIIFPPIIGIQAGANVWTAAIGFLITGIGLPFITIVAMAKANGNIKNITFPMGKIMGSILIIACYLCIGPFFGSPRTATVSWEIGIRVFAGDYPYRMYLFNFIYYLFAGFVALFPGKLLESVGHILAPLKITALMILALFVFLLPHVDFQPPKANFAIAPFSEGIVNGYLTMDTLAALAFGLVIVEAIRMRGIEKQHLVTRYTIRAGLIAGSGLALVYLSLFKLGLKSVLLVPNASNGADVLRAFVDYAFGAWGLLFLAILITIACFVTAIGLTCSCASYFRTIIPLSYHTLVVIFASTSFFISCIGLDELIKISIPVLIAVYPPFIILIFSSFFSNRLINSKRIIAPATAIALLCGIFDGFNAANLSNLIPKFYLHSPLSTQHMAWILPSAIIFMLSIFVELIKNKKIIQKTVNN